MGGGLRDSFRRGALVAVATGIGLAATTIPALAACNTPPELNPPQRGGVGTLDRPFVSGSGGRDGLVQVGSACGSPALKAGATKNDYLVTVVVKPKGGDPKVVALTAGSDCGECANGGRPDHCVSGSESGIRVSEAMGTLAFQFPDTYATAGPSAIAVTTAGSGLPCALAQVPCGALGKPDHLFACVDAIYAGDACENGPEHLDPDSPSFMTLPPANVFQKMCDESADETPACSDKDDVILGALDKEGNAAFPVSWQSILASAGGGKLKKRRVSLGTPYPAFATSPDPVDVPGADYLRSTTMLGGPWGDKPKFERKKPSGRGNELVLDGTADQGESVLWLFRRVTVGDHCVGGPKDGDPCTQGGASSCPSGTCTGLPDPSYFVCKGGGRDGKPCTQSEQCPSGSCTLGSSCYANNVPVPSTSCKTDAECTSPQICGPALFDFASRLVGGQVRIPKAVTAGQRGVCRGGSKNGDVCTSDAECDGKRCVGFRARAGKYQ